MKRMWPASILAIVLGLVSMAWAADSPAPASAEPAAAGEAVRPAIRFVSETADLGSVKQGVVGEHVFTFHNEGKAALEIYSVQPG